MSGDTLLRQWLMLRHIPRHPLRRSTTQIAQYLQGEDYEVTTRTVQRDLEKLSSIFGYTSDSEGRTNYWFFPQEQRVLDLPGMNSGAALALLLARDHTQAMIPPATLQFLSPYFQRAEEVLAEATPQKLALWRKRVKVINRGPILQPASIKQEVQSAVYDALMEQHQCKIEYRSRGAETYKEQVIHPLGLVLREGVMYLVATTWDYSDPVHYALHRVRKAEMLTEAVRTPKGFQLNEYVERAFHYPASPDDIKLSLRMDADVAYHLQERPLSADQHFVKSEENEDEVVITATVADTEELRWWILGFGEQIEVLKPVRLRREIAKRAQALAQRYAS